MYVAHLRMPQFRHMLQASCAHCGQNQNPRIRKPAHIVPMLPPPVPTQLRDAAGLNTMAHLLLQLRALVTAQLRASTVGSQGPAAAVRGGVASRSCRGAINAATQLASSA
jgi:hypothetical protein